MKPLKTYGAYLKIFVLGENEKDALESLNEALDKSNLLDQDGIVGFNPVEDDDVDEPEED
jgi:hypothetical protein